MIDAYLMTVGGAKKLVGQTGDRIVIQRDHMDMGPGQPTPIHTRHAWILGDEHFVVMKINTPVLVRLEKGVESSEFGPYAQMWIVDGMILSDLDEEKPVARFRYDSKLWLCEKDDTLWTTVTFIKV